MKLSGRRIRKAFEHMTPNVLNTVLPDDCTKKGVLIPMREKKNVIPLWLKKAGSAVAILVLLIGIGAVGLMILVGGQTPQLSGDPSDPIEDPTEIPEGPASEEKALAYLRQLVKVPEKYTLTKYNLEPYTDMYHVTFTYQINGIDTADCCNLMMRTDGSLYFSQVNCEGEFDNVQVTQDMVQDAEERLFDMYNLDRYPCTIIEFSHILWEDGVLSAAFSVQKAEGEFLSTYTVPLEKYDGIYDEEMAIKWAIKYAYRYLESEVFDVHCKQSDDGTYFDISFRYRTQKFLCKIDVNTGKVFDDRYEFAGVFETDNITRITVYAYYGTGVAIDITEKDMEAMTHWLSTFSYGNIAVGTLPEGTDSFHVEIEYADGRVIKQGLDTVTTDGITYYTQYETPPDCWEAIKEEALTAIDPPPSPPSDPLSVDMAYEYLQQHVADPSRYTLFDYFWSPDGLYTAIFYHQICGVDTTDLCMVIMREDGSLYNCVVDNEKAFDHVTITEEMLQIAQDNLYGMFTLSREEWTSEAKMIQWVDDKLMIQFLATKKDGTSQKSCNIPLNWNLPKPDDKTAVWYAQKYLALNGYILQSYSSSFDNSTDSPHYDVMLQVNSIRYECEIYISDGTVRNVRSEIVG